MRNDKLDTRNRDMAKAVLLDGRSMTAVGQDHGITRQRVKQIVDDYRAEYDDAQVDTFRLVLNFDRKEYLRMFVYTISRGGFFGSDFWIRKADEEEIDSGPKIRHYVIDDGEVTVDADEYDVYNPDEGFFTDDGVV